MSQVEDFGAAGDGKTDDTDAIQHAADDGDGVLEFGKGTYLIRRPIILDLTKRGYLGVRGHEGTTRLVMLGAGPALSFVGDHQGTAQPESVKPHTWDQERFPLVTGIEILGEDPAADGIRLFRTMQATIRGVLIRRCRVGIHLPERNRNFVLASSHIYDCSDTGVFFDRCNLHQTIITGNHISYCKRAGIRQLDGDVHNIQITGNDIEYNSGHESDVSGEIVLEAPQGIISEYTIASNTLQATAEARGANVLILGPEEDSPTGVRLVNITGNVLGSRDRNVVVRRGSRVNIMGNTIYGGAALNVDLADCEHVVVGSNTILTRPSNWKVVTTDGLRLERCRGCTVAGNILNDVRFGDARSGGAVTLRDCDYCAVSGCQVFDPLVRGIDLIDSSHCRISDNTVADRRTERTMLQAIRVSGTSAANLVQNNALGGGTEASIDCPPGKADVTGNTLWG